MAQVHDLLSKSESSQRVDVATYVTDLCDALRPITENDERIRFEAKVEEGILVDADTAVPLGIVLTELITNAVKYVSPHQGRERSHGSNQQWVASQALTSRPENQMRFPWVFSSHDYASRLVTVSVVWAAPSSVGLKG